MRGCAYGDAAISESFLLLCVASHTHPASSPSQTDCFTKLAFVNSFTVIIDSLFGVSGRFFPHFFFR